MAELPVELVHALMAHMADHASKINLALTSRSFYSFAMPLILAEEARYTRDVMIVTGQLSLYESPNSRRRLPPSCLDSPNGLFTGTFRKITFTPWQLAMSMYCIRRIVRCAPHLECISMHVLGGSLRVWLAAYINICVERTGVEFVLNGGSGDVVITVDDEEPYYEVGMGPQPMGRRNLPFDHPLNGHVLHLAASTSSNTPVSPSRAGFGRLQQWKAHLRRAAHSQSASSDGLIRPRISGLAITNEHLFSSRIASLVRMLVAGDHITSFTFSNIQPYPHYRHRKQGQQGVAGATSTTATPNSHTQPRPSSRSHQSHSSHSSSTSSSTFTNSSNIPAILDSLTFPCLTHLALAHLSLPPRALVRFLARHPLITDLRLEVAWSDAGEHDAGTMSATTTTTAAMTTTMAKMASTATHGVWGSDGMPMPTVPPSRRFLERLERMSGTPACVGAFVRWRVMNGKRKGEAKGVGVGVGDTYLPALVSVQLLAPYPGEELDPLECAAFGSVYDTLVGRGQAGPRVQGRGSDDISAMASTSGRVSVSSTSPATPATSTTSTAPTAPSSYAHTHEHEHAPTPASPPPPLSPFLHRWFKHTTTPSLNTNEPASTPTSSSASASARPTIRRLTLPPLASSWFLEWLVNALEAAGPIDRREHGRHFARRGGGGASVILNNNINGWPVLPGIEELTIASESSEACRHHISPSRSSSSPSPSRGDTSTHNDGVAEDEDGGARPQFKAWACACSMEGVNPDTLASLLKEMGRCWPEVVREVWSEAAAAAAGSHVHLHPIPESCTGDTASRSLHVNSDVHAGAAASTANDDDRRTIESALEELSRKIMHDPGDSDAPGVVQLQRVLESILWCTFPDLRVLQLQFGCASDSDGKRAEAVRIERPLAIR